MRLYRAIPHIACALIVIFFSACSDRTADKDDSQLIARVGKSSLRKPDLLRIVPGGLSQTDSIRYVSAYIRRWIDSHMISDIASSEIDLTEIDRLTEEYRNRLIELEYRRRMFETHVDASFPDDSLRNYYVENNNEFILERPLLKGLYLKIPQDASNLKLIRQLYKSDKPADVDRLEKEVLSSAVHYDYFKDKWVDWEQIELHIPYDFGGDPDTFLKGRNSFETEAGGFVYLLKIDDILPAGGIMPFDNARPMIRERLLAKRRQTYDAALMRQLYEKSLKDGKIQLFVELEP